MGTQALNLSSVSHCLCLSIYLRALTKNAWHLEIRLMFLLPSLVNMFLSYAITHMQCVLHYALCSDIAREELFALASAAFYIASYLECCMFNW